MSDVQGSGSGGDPGEKPMGVTGAAHVEDHGEAEIATLLADPVLLATYAEQAAESEYALGVWGSLKSYYPAIGWALVCATCVIMEGYDTILINNFFAYPEVRLPSTASSADTDVLSLPTNSERESTARETHRQVEPRASRWQS